VEVTLSSDDGHVLRRSRTLDSGSILRSSHSCSSASSAAHVRSRTPSRAQALGWRSPRRSSSATAAGSHSRVKRTSERRCASRFRRRRRKKRTSPAESCPRSQPSRS
jgi:hypothetical protein